MGRPKKVSDKELFEAIPVDGGISQRDLARKVGLSESTVSDRIGPWKDSGRVCVEEVRDGSKTLKMLSRVESPPFGEGSQAVPGLTEVVDQILEELAEIMPPFPAEPVEDGVQVAPTRPRHPNLSLLLPASIIFFAWSTSLLLFPLAEAIGADFGSITMQDIRNLVGIFLFLGGPLTLVWAWGEPRLTRKTSSRKRVLWRKTLLSISMLVWSLGTVLSALAQTLGGLITLQVVMILGFAPLSSIAVSIILDLFPTAQSKRVFLFLILMTLLGMGCGWVIAAVSITYVPWPVPIAVLGSFGFVSVGFVFDFEIHDTLPQVQEGHEETRPNHPITRPSSGARLLLMNLALNIALGSLIYFLIQMFIPPQEWFVLFVLAIPLILYTSHILYYLCRQNKEQRS
jgi:MFS family permease